MPPKTFKRQSVPSSFAASTEKRTDKQEGDKDFIPNS